jgi:alkylation response protein AidB-like acyl-CoA dehydrogenase
MLSDGFQPIDLPPAAEAFREPVREFLNEALSSISAVDRAFSWMGFDSEFSRKLGQRGWIGMTWPRSYGGGEESALARYVVVEELLAAGAPVLAHWTADRQSGPLILNFGTQEQKERFLPAICRGESFFCIGMSEPNAGSDLAATRSRAVRTDDGWMVNGAKLWTTNAHRCQYMIALLRTSPGSEKQQGLSQIVIDLRAPGVTVRPIRDLTGEFHFNEVVFEDALVPLDNLIGIEGGGWSQVTSELAFERSGPERYLSTIALLNELLNRVGSEPAGRIQMAVGRLVAHMIVLRQMSLAIAGQLQQKKNPQPSLASSDYQRVLAYITQVAPSFSLRGGTREILRGIIARGMGLR